MINIKTIKTNNTLKEVFIFMSKVFYEEAIEFKEHYHPMSDRYDEMTEQFNKDNSLLLYIEENGKIVA